VTATPIPPKPGDTAAFEVRSGPGGVQILASCEIDVADLPASMRGRKAVTARAWQHLGCWDEVLEVITALHRGATEAFGPASKAS
jgi:hypothetical protein